MKVTVEDLSSVKKILHVEIPQDVVTKELNNAYKHLKNTAKVKGFRPGKTPRHVLERIYKKDVNADVSSKLIQDSFIEAIKETGLNMAANPDIDPGKLNNNMPLKYDATIEIVPELGDIDFKGLTLKKTLYKIDEEMVDSQLVMLQKNMAAKNPITDDRPVKEGDLAIIDFEGFKDGKPFDATKKIENYTLKIGDAQILKEFDAQIVGMKQGDDKEIKINFPEDYFNENLSNLEITFKVELKKIMEEVLPDIDDELAKKLARFETLDDLKEEIRQNLKEGFDRRVEQELNEQIFEALLAKKEFKVPDSMVDNELEGIIAEAQSSFAFHNTSMEALGLTREGLVEKYRDTAEKQVKRHLILGKVVEQEKLTLLDKDIDDGLMDMSKNMNQPFEEIKNYYGQNREQLEHFKHTLLEKNAIGLIIKESRIDEIEPDVKPDAK